VTRTVSPLAIGRRRGLLCCAGYYDEVGTITWLPIARFETAEATDEPFTTPPHFKVDDDRATMYPEPFVAVIRLHDLRDAERFESAAVVEDDTLRVEFYDSPTLLSLMLGCRAPFEIVSPAWLRGTLLARLGGLVSVNRDPRT
jgi:hypothetical protein